MICGIARFLNRVPRQGMVVRRKSVLTMLASLRFLLASLCPAKDTMCICLLSGPVLIARTMTV